VAVALALDSLARTARMGKSNGTRQNRRPAFVTFVPPYSPVEMVYPKTTCD
jgi:hypothetical protein